MPWVAHFKTGVAPMAFSCPLCGIIGTHIVYRWVKAEVERHRQSVRYIKNNKQEIPDQAARRREGEKKIIRRKNYVVSS